MVVVMEDSDDEKKVFEENVDVLSQAQAKEAGVGVGNHEMNQGSPGLTCHYNSQWLFCHNLPVFSHHYLTSSF